MGTSSPYLYFENTEKRAVFEFRKGLIVVIAWIFVRWHIIYLSVSQFVFAEVSFRYFGLHNFIESAILQQTYMPR